MQITEDSKRLFEVTPDHAKALKWLEAAMSNDDSRPVLNAIHTDGQNAVTCDGYRLHAVKACDLPLNEPGTWHLTTKVPASGGFCSCELVPDRYPNYGAIMPKTDPALTVTIDANLLREALTGMDGPVVLELRKPDQPIEVKGYLKVKGENVAAYALIMPIYIGPHSHNPPSISTWRPSTENGNGNG